MMEGYRNIVSCHILNGTIYPCRPGSELVAKESHVAGDVKMFSLRATARVVNPGLDGLT